MADITQQEAQAQLDLWLERNRKAAASPKGYGIAGRSFENYSPAEILEQIKFWRSEVARLSRGGGIRTMRTRIAHD